MAPIVAPTPIAATAVATALRCLCALPAAGCARRPFSQARRALASPPADKFDSLLGSVDHNFRRASPESLGNIIPNQGPSAGWNLAAKEWEDDIRYKLHIYATRHNTHLTLAAPDRNALISVSCGNIGFRKAARGSYDAAYQLTAFVMSRIKDKGLLPQIKKIELVYRGFGQGREAVTKAILGAEGKRIQPLICKLSDSTRLKFGGVRSKKPRRLG